jgi:hypothetical protein
MTSDEATSEAGCDEAMQRYNEDLQMKMRSAERVADT